MDFFSLIMLALALYVLVAAISGKGNLYDTSNIKEGMEEKYKKTMRACYAALAVEMLFNAGSSILISVLFTTDDSGATVPTEAFANSAFGSLSVTFFQVVGYVMFGLMILTIALMMFSMRRFIDKDKQKAAQEEVAKARNNGHVLPTSAFEFDENGDLKDEDDDSEMSPEEKEFKEELAAITNEELEDEIIDHVEEEEEAMEEKEELADAPREDMTAPVDYADDERKD